MNKHLQLEKDFGTRVRELRRACNWSQEYLAQRLKGEGFEMHQTTVAKIEAGTRPLRVAEAAALAHIFSVPPPLPNLIPGYLTTRDKGLS